MILDKPTKHPYYCAASNFYSNEAEQEFETVTDFLDEFTVNHTTDIDRNLIFRFDIEKDEDDTSKPLSLFIGMIQQRKGIYKPIRCLTYDPATEGERLEKYLQTHLQRLLENWLPLKPA